MTSVHLGDDGLGSAAPHLLHNSGPGSREVFRTAAIGELVVFALGRALLDWPGWGADEPPRLGRLLRRRADIPPAIAIAAARHALVALGETHDAAPVPRDQDRAARAACDLLARLARALRERGQLDHLVGLASHKEVPHAAQPAEGSSEEPRSSAADFARTLVAHSVYAPPLLLWTRPPSLHWWRADVRITLRQFHSPGCLTGIARENAR